MLHSNLTTTATDIYYNDIIVEIIDLIGVSSLSFRRSEELQSFIANATYYGMAKITNDFAIDKSAFYVEYGSVSGEINITQSVCAEMQSILSSLQNMVSQRTSEIAGYIENKTVKYFEDDQGVTTEHMTVNVYWGS